MDMQRHCFGLSILQIAGIVSVSSKSRERMETAHNLLRKVNVILFFNSLEGRQYWVVELSKAWVIGISDEEERLPLLIDSDSNKISLFSRLSRVNISMT